MLKLHYKVRFHGRNLLQYKFPVNLRYPSPDIVGVIEITREILFWKIKQKELLFSIVSERLLQKKNAQIIWMDECLESMLV